jgi:glycosyltransferase involved in cell wall biosynthesis
MKISVVMCTFNGGRFLNEQLKSITMQTRMPDELILCDDGSTDETLQILKSYVNGIQFHVVIRCNPKRLGAAKNFEQGITLTRGDMIVLSDQDDVWRCDKLQIMEQVLSGNPDAGYAFSDAILIDGDGKIVHHTLWQRVPFDSKKRTLFSGSPMDQVRTLFHGNVVTGATLAFRASLKANILPVPELWIHDEWIAFASSLNGSRGIPIPEPLIYYRLHPAQAIGVRAPGAHILLRRAWQSFTGSPQAYEIDAALRKWRSSYALLQSVPSHASTLLPLLEAKLAHLSLRARLYRKPRPTRLAAILAELTRGGYHYYAGGWKSVVKDLLVPRLNDFHAA